MGEARQHRPPLPRDVVRLVLNDEARAGRVELAHGRARIVRAAFPANVLAALAALTD